MSEFNKSSDLVLEVWNQALKERTIYVAKQLSNIKRVQWFAYGFMSAGIVFAIVAAVVSYWFSG